MATDWTNDVAKLMNMNPDTISRLAKDRKISFSEFVAISDAVEEKDYDKVKEILMGSINEQDVPSYTGNNRATGAAQSATNAPSAAMQSSSAMPASPKEGQLWYDKSDDKLKVFDTSGNWSVVSEEEEWEFIKKSSNDDGIRRKKK